MAAITRKRATVTLRGKQSQEDQMKAIDISLGRRAARRPRRFLSRTAGLALAVSCLVSSEVLAQTGTSASISGAATDQGGASVVGATVTVHNVDTGIDRTTKTQNAGNFNVSELPPGHYTLRVAEPGFKSFEQQNVTLTIGQIAEINAHLEVGAQQEQVTVTAGAPTIQTEDSSVGLVVDSATITDTPLNGRLGITGLLALAPGVQGAGSQDQIPVYGVAPSINTGSRNAYGALGFTLDGGVNMYVGLQRPLGEVPPLDGIGEFKVITTDAPAEYNQASQIVVISKGGTNRFHGTLLEFNRVAATSAKYYFAGASRKPKYIRNEFGGDVSGPILIPHLYNGRDRSFFFFNYEGFRLAQASSLNSQMPTMAERSGDFSGIAGLTLKDPLTGTAFPNNQIPTGRINGVDQQLQNLLYPLPTAPGNGTNTFEVVPYTNSVERFSFRLDHKAGERDQFRATFIAGLYGPNPSTGATSRFGGMSGIGERNLNTVLGWTHIFSPTLVGDFTAAYLHLPFYRTPQNVNTDFPSIIPGLGPEFIEGAPQISISNITGVSEAGSKALDQDIQLSGSLNKNLGAHNLKIGVSYLHDNTWNDIAAAPQRGAYSFNGQYSGNAYADFLLGYPASTQKPNPNNQILRSLSHQAGAFIQDDWKVSRNLTINAGLRYDIQYFDDSPYGNNSLYIPSLGKIVIFGSSYPGANAPQPVIPAFLNLPIEFASQAGLPHSLFSYLGQSTKNVAPRFGLAYQVNNNTVIRGGFGLYYNLIPDYYIQNYAFENIPFFGVQTFSQPTGVPTLTMNAPFAGTGAFASNPSVNAQHKTVTPYTEEYNLAIEHQIGRSVSFRIGYVGQNNIKQNNSNGPGNTTPDLNQPTPAAGAVQPRRPVQPFASIFLTMDPIFHSNSNALQVGVHKRFESGFQLNAEYEWIRVLGTENFVNPMNTGDSYGNIGGIAPQSLNVSYSYVLPFGRDKHFLHSAGNLTNTLVSGWEISGITQYQGGQPFSVGYNTSVQGSYNSRADRVSGQPLYPGHKSLREFFNAAAFTAPAPFTFGNSAYNPLFGPRYQDWDINLVKSTTIFEKATLQLRADSFNIFNHPNFATPNATVSNPGNFGQITSTTGEPRTVEFGAKLLF